MVGASISLPAAANMQLRQMGGGAQADRREAELAAARDAVAAAEADAAAAGERATDAQAEARSQGFRLITQNPQILIESACGRARRRSAGRGAAPRGRSGWGSGCGAPACVSRLMVQPSSLRSGASSARRCCRSAPWGKRDMQCADGRAALAKLPMRHVSVVTLKGLLAYPACVTAGHLCARRWQR